MSVFDEAGVGIDLLLLDGNPAAPLLVLGAPPRPIPGFFLGCLDDQEQD